MTKCEKVSLTGSAMVPTLGFYKMFISTKSL